jgi:hypothetical protein
MKVAIVHERIFVKRRKISATNIGPFLDVEDHFEQILEMVSIGSERTHSTDDMTQERLK